MNNYRRGNHEDKEETEEPTVPDAERDEPPPQWASEYGAGVPSEARPAGGYEEGEGLGGPVVRAGDYIVHCSMLLNCAAMLAYASQGFWRNAAYFLGAFIITLSIGGMK